MHNFWMEMLVAAKTGLIAAVGVDYIAFRAFKRWDDVVKYDWSVATFRWFQGIFFAVTGTAGLKGLLAAFSNLFQ